MKRVMIGIRIDEDVKKKISNMVFREQHQHSKRAGNIHPKKNWGRKRRRR